MWGSEVYAGVQVAAEVRGLRSPRGGADRAGVLPWIDRVRNHIRVPCKGALCL